jgi:hypothetical protein
MQVFLHRFFPGLLFALANEKRQKTKDKKDERLKKKITE